MGKSGREGRVRRKGKGIVEDKELKKVELKKENRRGEGRKNEDKTKVVTNPTSQCRDRMHANWFPYMDKSPWVHRITRRLVMSYTSRRHKNIVVLFLGVFVH
jgi:hypothetical protein